MKTLAIGVGFAILGTQFGHAQDAIPTARGVRGGRSLLGNATFAVRETAFPMPQQIRRPGELQLKQEFFTFVRVQYDSQSRPGRAAGAAGRPAYSGYWRTDYPEADQSFIRRFQDVTGIKSELEPKVLRLTDLALVDFPFLYVVEGGPLHFTPEEAHSLRTYLKGGGFMLVDDSWGEASWRNVLAQFKLVFPEQEPADLDLRHPIFHSFYDFQELPQVRTFGDRRFDNEPVRYAGVSDDSGRLMVFICHNNDLGDGWERERYDETYAQEYSRKQAFPMGINAVVYALTKAAAD